MTRTRSTLRSAAPLLALCAALLTGCSASSYQRVPVAEIGREVPTDRGRIVVLRSAQFAGSSRPIYVRSGGREIGRLASSEYLTWDVAPGRKVVDVIFDRPLIDGEDLEGIGAIEVEAGSTAYVEIVLQDAPELSAEKSQVGLPILVPLSKEEGERRVATAEAAPFDPDR